MIGLDNATRRLHIEAGGGMSDSLTPESRDSILRRICGEYLEMPGLRLTQPQAQRLW